MGYQINREKPLITVEVVCTEAGPREVWTPIKSLNLIIEKQSITVFNESGEPEIYKPSNVFAYYKMCRDQKIKTSIPKVREVKDHHVAPFKVNQRLN